MRDRITISDLAKALSVQQKIPLKEAEVFVHTFFDLAEESLLRDKLLKIKNFGSFKVLDVSDRESVDVNTGERIRIQGHSKISFSPDTVLRDKVNKPFSAFQTIILNDQTDVEEMTRIPEQAEKEDEELDIETDDMVQETVLPEESPVEPVLPETTTTETPNMEPEPIVEETEPTREKPIQEIQANEVESALPVDANEADPVLSLTDDVNELNMENKNQTIPDAPKGNNGIQWNYIVYFLFTILLMVLSYFAGYYRLLCPCDGDYEAQPVVVEQKPTTDSIALKVETVAESNTSVDTITAKSDEDDVDTEEHFEDKFPQVPGGKYLITGTRRIHKMSVGDNLFMMAKKEYGDKSFAQYIIVYNQFKNPDVIPLGYDVKIPELRENK